MRTAHTTRCSLCGQLRTLYRKTWKNAGTDGTFFGNAVIENIGARPACRGSRSLSLPRPLLTLHHDSSQYPVDSRLVARTFGLEPVDHFGIHTQRKTRGQTGRSPIFSDLNKRANFTLKPKSGLNGAPRFN